MPSPHINMKSGKAGNGSSHASYIAGVGRHKDRGDVIAVLDVNMPEWAKDGVDFFDAADKFERSNGRAYTEIEAAIPRGIADPIGYATRYADKLLGSGHPYRLAVHDKLAGDGGQNTHLHLMFSERKLDGVERSREQFFKRVAAPYRDQRTKLMMPADPSRGGAGKEKQWNKKEQVQIVRDGWQEFARQHGITLDLRSNQAKGLGAPEPKLGPEHPRSGLDPRREARKEEIDRLRQIREIEKELRIINQQEREHGDTESRAKNRKNGPAAGLAQMHQLRAINHIHDIGGFENLLQQDARHKLQQPIHGGSRVGLHQLGADPTTRNAVLAQAVPGKAIQKPPEAMQPSPARRATSQVPIMVDGGWTTAEQLVERKRKMEYTRQLEADLRARNAQAAAELRARADRLAEQVASGEKTPLVLKTANEHVKNAEILEKIASAPLQPPEPSLLERLAASWSAMLAWIKELGPLPERVDVDTEAGKYQGKFVNMDDLHAIQKTGRTTYHVHLLEALDRKPEMNNIETRVQYEKGRGRVTGEPDRGDRGKGGIGG